MGYQEEDELSEEGFLEMMADYEKLSTLQEQYRKLPNSPKRVELCREFVSVADRLEEPSEQLAGRFDLAYAYVFGEDPAKALPVCAEFMRLQQENPGELGEAEGDAVISIAMLASSIARRLPQIPLEQCKSLLEEFRNQVRTYGLGERLWQCHAGEFAMMTGDLAALEEHLEQFREAPRDDVSDCAVCEVCAMAEYLLALGRRSEAVSIVEELLQKKEFCEEQPWKLLSILTDDALERNDLREAERFSAAMVIQPVKTAADLRRVGTLLRMKKAAGDWKEGLKLLKKSLPWTNNFWDQELLFCFYVGAAVFCHAHSPQHSEIKLPSVPGFTDCPENGLYDCAALARWFWSRAEEIGARFDRRSGCSNYRKRLKQLIEGPLEKEESHMESPKQLQNKEQENDEQSPRASFGGFVLLAEGKWDKQQFIRDMKEKWDITAEEDKNKLKDTAVFEIGGMVAAVSLVPRPIPNREAELNAENNYLWPDAVKAAREHRAHIMVTVLGKEEDVLEKGKLYTKLVAACCRQEYATGVYTGGVVFEPRFYEEFADMMQEGELPIFNWIWFGLYRSEGGLNAYTYGMDVFGKDEMEVLNADAEPNDLRNFLASLTGFVLENDIELQDGKTIGFTAEDRHTITRSPGVSLSEEQMTLKISWKSLDGTPDNGGKDGSDGEDTKDEGPDKPEVYTEEEMETVEEHIVRYFGQVENVFHELISPDIHVDIYVVAPSEERNYYTLVTMGMGAHRMNVPKELAEYKLERAELVIALPADWKLNQESIQDERWYWPIRLLKALARLPIVNDTWLTRGHTMDNTKPFAENTELCAFILTGAQSPMEGCQICTLPNGDEVNFYQVLPLYRNELEYKLEHDAAALLERMEHISFVVQTDRRNAIH